MPPSSIRVLIEAADRLQLSPDKLDGLAADLRADGFDVDVGLGVGKARGRPGVGVTWTQVLDIVVTIGGIEGAIQAVERLKRIVQGWQARRSRPQVAHIYDENGSLIASVECREPRRDVTVEQRETGEGFPDSAHPESFSLQRDKMGMIFYERHDQTHRRLRARILDFSPDELLIEVYEGEELARLPMETTLKRLALFSAPYRDEEPAFEDQEWGQLRVLESARTGEYRHRVRLVRRRP